MRLIFLYFFLSVCICTAAPAKDYQLNSTSSNDQTSPAAAIDAKGNITIVWNNYNQDANSGGIFARQFDKGFNPIGDEFQVNSAAWSSQSQPAVAMKPDGNFIVAWHGPGDNQEDIFAKIFNADGKPLGSQFRVNSTTAGRQMYPHVATGGNGNFVIVWESEISLPPFKPHVVCFQLYDSNGSHIGPEQQANILTEARYPDVTMDFYGNFTIAWMQHDSQHSYNQVMFRMYNNDDSPKTDPNSINTTPFYADTHPSISCADSGHFVVTWEANPTSAALNDIYARWYKWDGSPRCNEFIVNTSTAGAQQNPKVAMNDQRDFIVVWDSYGDIHAQRFDEFAHSVGDEFIINTYTFSDQKFPTAVIKEDGAFAIAWQSLGQDGSGWGIFGATGPQIPCADFTNDLFVNFRDYCTLAKEWLRQGDPLTSDLINDNSIDYQDIAAFSEQWLTPCYDCAYADLNSDGKINLKDFALLASDWLKQGPNIKGDLNSNGCADATDLHILLSHWLELCN